MKSPRERLVDVQLAAGHGELVTSRRGVPYLLGTQFNICWFQRKRVYKIFRRGSNAVMGRATSVEGVIEILKSLTSKAEEAVCSPLEPK